MKKRTKAYKPTKKTTSMKRELYQLMNTSQYNSDLIKPFEKHNYEKRSFIRLPKNEKIKILQNDLYREAYRLAEFLTADSYRRGYVK
ncbi:MAG: hypothetical protein HeimC3_11270 [Candidatus Heimdallarchaeota archaeon LC_3]|nr:MAG: hypothetical protein HeimC3_11270 [Candidatus Heimdallarchaeota archaeon LC_3]